MEKVYQVSVTAVGGRDGSIKSSDGILDLKLVPAKEMGGPGGATNPEQLFAGGYAACYLGAFKRAAADRQLPVRELTVTVENSLMTRDEGGFVFSVRILVRIAGMDKKTAQEVAAAAENICPFANSTRGNVKTEVIVETV